ncbi:PhlD [Actinacidiphila glaucinigra]|uniref:1,3,6,8-tetrahydroxynaphthalene synthase n=1 Tax=Actinacidiphila glaucinigra TaxID=235986 RepID=A0A239LU00_9ACTN|nr:PhlD [Actinacidiphila glaucinigra]SNT34016.1 1,3,6,8-tetrahydroxynaphthalene synthase [Actinacidiphila glaucinigra]
MTAFVTCPRIVLPPHKVTTGEILDDIRAHHSDHARLAVILRAVTGCGVDTRYFTRPLSEVAHPRGAQQRIEEAFGDAAEMAVQAARQALEASGVRAAEVDCVITSHTTSWAVPNLDVHLIGALGLRPTVSRIPLATLACAGGVHALVRAADYLRARPGSRVLVTVAEVLSAIYHRTDTTIESMIYRALFGDSAGAVLVTDEPLGSGLAVEDGVEILLPDSLDRYWGRLDHEGLHFDSTKKAARAAVDTLPLLQEWMGPWQPDWAVVHPGGPRIITDMAAGIGLVPQAAWHSVDSLREVGNLGGVAVLDVLARTPTDPPVNGSEGLAVAVGPGFTLSGVRGHWHS